MWGENPLTALAEEKTLCYNEANKCSSLGGVTVKRERGIAYCGLACALCESLEDCPGCRKGGCPDREQCKNYTCCQERGLAGCWECEEFPCSAPMLAKIKPRSFCVFIKRYGEEKLLDCLEQGQRDGLVYHRLGTVVGDYDMPSQEEGVFGLLLGEKTE